MRQFRPLRGVRVLSFETAFSLPAGTHTLAELGAEVVRVGRPERDSPAANYTIVIDGLTLNKASVSLDLGSAEGQALARRLAVAADAVCTNFRPRVSRRAGLDYGSLRELRPDVIVLQLTGYGTPGPWQDAPAYGASTEAAGGMNQLLGAADGPPTRIGSGIYSDQVSGRYAALALIAALVRRRRSGTGQYIDLSMTEGISHLLGERLLCTALTGTLPPRHGNCDPRMAPQGVYPCRGVDEWVAISIATDAQWCCFAGLSGDAALEDARYATLAGRRTGHDFIDERIAAWTIYQEKGALAALLQEHGIPAGPVQKTSEMPFDAQLATRGAFQAVRHEEPVLGYTAHPHLTTPWQVIGRARTRLVDGRVDGLDNRRVLKRWLGAGAAEVRRLERSGALRPARRLRIALPALRQGTPVDDAFAERLQLPAAEGAE